MRWRGLGLKSSIMGPSQWNYLDFRCDSDFFTLDPNLATALRLNDDAGGIQAPLRSAQNVENHAKRKDQVARQGKDEPVSFVGYRARCGATALAVAVAVNGEGGL